MNTVIIKNNWIFYPLLLGAWSTFILIRFSDYHYYGSAPQSVSQHMQISSAFYKKKAIEKSIEELRDGLKEEKDINERGHIKHNIGTAYYERYKVSRSGKYLDSAKTYYLHSIEILPDVARFYYNLGRIHTEKRKHLNAKKYYEKALQLDPSHVLALHNLALLNFYELGNRQTARELLSRALQNRPSLPICHYVLGEIALKQKKYKKALEHFRQEIGSRALLSKKDKKIPVSSTALRYAVSKSHLRLAILYSTKFANPKHAQKNLNAYLRLEPDKNKREAAIKKLKRYWKVKSK